MNQQKNENRNPHQEDRSNQRTNQEKGRNDLNPTDRDERNTDREFDLDEEKERKLEVSSKTVDPEKDKNRGQKENVLPRHEDPNVNAENENHREKTGTMRNQPQSDRMLSQE